MRKNKAWFSVLLVSATLTLTACNTGTSSSIPDYSFEGFTVLETATGELGTYYTFETPEITYGEKSAAVTVTVTGGDETIPHDNQKVYLDSMQSYVITYTATCDGDSESKSTTLTVSDTTAPAFSNRLEGAIQFGTSVIVSDYITARDSSEITTLTYTATKTDGTALPDGAFDAESHALCVTDESIHGAKITVSATDKYDNTASGEFILPFSLQPTYGAFDFSWFEKDTQDIGGVAVKTGADITQPAKVIEENGEKYLSVAFTTTTINQYTYVQLDKELIGDFSAFDAVDVEMMLDYNGEGANGGNGSLSGSEFGSAPINSVQNIFAANRGKWFTYRYQGEQAQKSITDNQGVYLLFKPWAMQNVTIKIKRITGVYTLPSEENASFDLTQEFSLAETELSNVKFNGVAVENVKAFQPTAEGTLTFDAQKEGHKKGAFNVHYTMPAKPFAYGEVFHFAYPNMSEFSAGTTVAGGADAKSTVTKGEDEVGNYVQIVTKATQWVNIRFFGADSADTLKNFDWFSVRFAGYYLTDNDEKYTDANICVYAQSNETSGKTTQAATLAGNDTLQTYTANRNTSANFDNALSDPFRMIFQNFAGYLQDGTTFKTMVLRIYGVQFGYNAIHLTEDLPTIDLTKRLGLTAQELSNVKFNDVAVTDITSFATTENGTLTFDVAKDGYVATSMSLEVTYTPMPEYNPLCSIENPDLSKWSLNSTTAGKADTAAKGLSMVAGSDANGKYIEFTTTGGEWPNIRYLTSNENAANLKKYDWFSVKIAAWQYTGATDLTSTEGIRQTGTLVTGKNISVRPNNSNGKSTPMNGAIATLTWNRKDCTDFDTMIYGEWNGAGRMFKLTFYNSDAPVIIRIYDIEFGYNDIATDGTAIDLTSKFNATANEITATFTPTGGTETAVTDVTAFTATQSGTLKVTIKKTGYKAVTYTITVNKE